MVRLLSILLKNLIVLLAIEVAVRALAALGMVALPANDVFGFDRNLQGADAPAEKRLYQADRNLIYRLRPNADIVYPRNAQYPGKSPTYEVHTNARGFRTPLVPERKPPGTFRIACLGDSVTFGFNVDEPGTYPRVLAALLERAYPGRFQVLNFGIPGYSSRQELELLRREVLRYGPDLVTFAVGANDRLWMHPLSDDEMIRLGQSFAGGLVIELRECLDHSYAYRLLKRGIARAMPPDVDAGKPKPSGTPRVSLEGIRDNIIAVDSLLRQRGAALLLLNADLFGTDAASTIAMGAQQTGGTYLDIQRIFAEARRTRTQQIEAAHQLPAAATRPRMTLFRVYAPGETDVSLQWSLLGGEATTLPMRDDGLEGDQVAGDSIWSAFVPGPAGQRILYAYWHGTGAARARDFASVMQMATWRMQLLTATGVGEVDTFGTIYLRSDNSHPDEEGDQLIADHLLPAILAHGHVQAFLASK